MKQNKIQSVTGLINAGTLILGGVTELGTEIGMTVSTQTEVAQELTDLVMACGNLEQGKQVKATRRSALVEALDKSRTHIRVVRDTMKIPLGYEYSDRWTGLGYQNGSLGLPSSIEDIGPMLQVTKLFFANNPTLEVPALKVTAADSQAAFDALAAAQNAVAAQEMAIEALMNERDAKANTFRQRIGIVVKELAFRLDPLDPRWLRFGLNMPDAQETPDTPEQLKATLIGPTAVALKWAAAPRADYYRVFKKVNGVDEAFIAVGTPADLDFTVEGLPANSTIEIQISAVNNGGESSRTASVTVVTHS